MGMGEPLMNYSEVSRSIVELRSTDRFKRPWAITVSTVGVVPRIAALAADHPEVGLAVSLHAPNQELRKQLVPAGARRWPLEEIMEAVKEHETVTGRVPMFAYTVLPGVNDSVEHAIELAALLSKTRLPGGQRPFVNLVPYNRTEAGELHGFRVPRSREIRNFRSLLKERGMRATVRWSTAEGRPLSAACGQLTASVEKHPGTLTQDSQANASTISEVVLEETESTTIAAPVLTRKLAIASSVEELLELVVEHDENLNHIHVSAALATLARSYGRFKSPLIKHLGFEVLLRRLQIILPTSTAQTCANALWAFAKCQHKPNQTLAQELAEASIRHIDHFWPQNIANSLWACSKLRYKPSAHGPIGNLATELAGTMKANVEKFTCVELSNSLKAIASLQLVVDKETLQAIAATANCQISRMGRIEVTNLLSSFAELAFHPGPEILQSFAGAAERKYTELKISDQIACLRALAVLGHRPSDTLLTTTPLLVEQWAPKLSPGDLSDFLWTFATIGSKPSEQCLEALVQATNVQNRKAKVRKPEVATLLWSFAELRHNPGKETLTEWLQTLQSGFAQLPATEISRCMSSFASFGFDVTHDLVKLKNSA